MENLNILFIALLIFSLSSSATSIKSKIKTETKGQSSTPSDADIIKKAADLRPYLYTHR